jgi:hypothetical protein
MLSRLFLLNSSNVGRRADRRRTTANVSADEPAVTIGQADALLLFKVQFAEMLGLFPLVGIGKVNAALPTFSTATVRGLSST